MIILAEAGKLGAVHAVHPDALSLQLAVPLNLPSCVSWASQARWRRRCAWSPRLDCVVLVGRKVG
jgi:hypothetical protein